MAEVTVVQAKGEAKGRVLFRGDKESAKAFVEQHFPHHHVNPPGDAGTESKPDVKIVEGAADDEEEED